jgi:hypothetical protein
MFLMPVSGAEARPLLFADGRLDEDLLGRLSDDEVEARLTQISGIRRLDSA